MLFSGRIFEFHIIARKTKIFRNDKYGLNEKFKVKALSSLEVTAKKL